MILEALFIFGGLYLLLGLGMYVQAVITTYQTLGTWNFNITKESIGVCKYPYWILFWLERQLTYSEVIRVFDETILVMSRSTYEAVKDMTFNSARSQSDPIDYLLKFNSIEIAIDDETPFGITEVWRKKQYEIFKKQRVLIPLSYGVQYERVNVFVDCDRDKTFINRIDLKDGKCLPPKRIKGVLTEQSLDLIYLIKNDFYSNVGMCTKIVFDEFGYGRGLKEIFIRDMYYEREFKLHINGDITSPYYEEAKKKKEEEPFADFKWRKFDE